MSCPREYTRTFGAASAVAVGALLLLLLPFTSAAVAAPKSIAGFIGGPNGGLAGQFSQPRDVAVYEGTDGDTATDKIFVVESNNDRVDRLDRDGNFERMWGRNVDAVQAGTGFEICTVAANCQAPSSGGSGALKGEFSEPVGLAVDQVNGWVYVYDRDNRRVQKFDLDGNFILAFGKGVNVTTGGDVCTQASGDVCGIGATGTGAATLATSTQSGLRGLAVDPVTGSVFVADPTNRRVLQFSSAGVFARGWGWDVDKATVDNRFETCTATCGAGVASAPVNSDGAFTTNQPLHLAVDSNGIVYASDAAPTTSTQRVIRFDSDPAPGSADATASLATAIASPPLLSSGTTATFGLEIDADSDGGGPDEEHLLVVRDPASGNTVVQEFDIPAVPTDPILAAQLVDTHTFAATGVNGLGVNAGTGNIYIPLSQSSTIGIGIAVLDDTSGPPLAVAQAAGSVGATTATLFGTVTPGGGDGPVTYRFEISADGSTYTAVGSTPGYVSGAAPVAVSLPVAGLDPNTLYRVRIVATRVTGLTTSMTVTSPDVIFVTASALPEAVTLPVGPRTDTTAEIRATVDPNGSATNYYFEYGGDATYGAKIPLNPAPAGSGNEPLAVTEQLSGLLPATTYHYRVVADGFGPPVNGADRAFTTQPVAAAHGPDPDRVFELVSPADKVGGSGVGPWYVGVGAHGNAGVSAYAGDRFAPSSTFGGALADGGFSYGTDWTLAERTPAGWTNKPALNRPGGFGSSEFAKLPYIDAFSDDLSLTAWGANSVMRIFVEQADAFGDVLADGRVIREWDSGRWELVAPLAPEQQVVGFGAVRATVAAPAGGAVLTSGLLRGVAGLDDPTHLTYSGGPSDLFCPNASACNGSVYFDDVSAGLSDSFPGAGIRTLVNVCTGTGASRTDIPSVVAGKVTAADCPDAPVGRPEARLIDTRGASLAASGRLPGQLSRDGSRTFFMSPDHGNAANHAACAGTGADGTVCPPQLYVSQRNAGGGVSTRWISQSAVTDQDASLMAAAVFEGATPDGDKVFFRTAAPLTADDPNGGAQVPGGVKTGSANPNSVDLYMYDMPDGPDGDPATPDGDPAGGTLTRISAGPAGAGDGNVYTGGPGAQISSVRALADDGSRVYFTTAAPIAGVPAAADGTVTAPAGTVSQTATKNLYVYDGNRPPAQRWSFVANLPAGSNLGGCAATGALPAAGLQPGPNATGTNGTLEAGSAVRNCVRTTGDGAFVTFFTDGRLTADDPDAVTGDVYGYDAETDALTRLSAPQGGAGGSYVCVTDPAAGAALGTRCHGDPAVGGNYSNAELGLVTDPAEPGDRVAFLESAIRLVPEDQNDVFDVYQWRNGELSLVSTGAADADHALYRGNDAAGRNVYVSSRDALSWQDHDAVLDVYSAHVGEGIPQPDPPPLCSLIAGSCQAGPAVGPVDVDARSGDGGGENVDAGPRMRLAIAQPSRRALARAARRGTVAVRVRSNTAGVSKVVARARIGGRVRTVGRARARFSGAGARTVRVALNRAARKRLNAGRRLRVRVVARAPGARPTSVSILLRRAGR